MLLLLLSSECRVVPIWTRRTPMKWELLGTFLGIWGLWADEVTKTRTIPTSILDSLLGEAIKARTIHMNGDSPVIKEKEPIIFGTPPQEEHLEEVIIIFDNLYHPNQFSFKHLVFYYFLLINYLKMEKYWFWSLNVKTLSKFLLFFNIQFSC